MIAAVYFLQSQKTGLIKIGHSAHLRIRAASLEREHGPLTALGIVPGSMQAERAIHFLFDADRETGEWFRPTQALLTFIHERSMPWPTRPAPLPRRRFAPAPPRPPRSVIAEVESSPPPSQPRIDAAGAHCQSPPTPGAALAALRRRVPGVCAVCGAAFVGYAGRRTCSATCRSLLRYRRNRAARQAAAGPPAG